MMAYAVGRQLKFAEETRIDLSKSAGPATVVLVTVDSEKVEELALLLRKPVTTIGEIL